MSIDRTTILISPTLIQHDPSFLILGQGKFGNVRKAIYAGQVIAIKSFESPDENKRNEKYTSNEDRLHVMIDGSLEEGFLVEARKIMDLSHPKIIKFLGFEQTSLSIVMEYMELGSLLTYIKALPATESIPWKVRMGIVYDILQGMNYLHSMGPIGVVAKASQEVDVGMKSILLHQNLKSENVLLTLLPNGVLRAKISDFGLSEFANFVKDDKKSSIFFKHMDGARQYQAPELQANPKFTELCDVYSFGAILLEIITLLPASEVLLRKKYTSISMTSSLRPVLSYWPTILLQSSLKSFLKCILVKTLHPDPSKRIKFDKILEIVKDKIRELNALESQIEIPDGSFSSTQSNSILSLDHQSSFEEDEENMDSFDTMLKNLNEDVFFYKDISFKRQFTQKFTAPIQEDNTIIEIIETTCGKKVFTTLMSVNEELPPGCLVMVRKPPKSSSKEALDKTSRSCVNIEDSRKSPLMKSSSPSINLPKVLVYDEKADKVYYQIYTPETIEIFSYNPKRHINNSNASLNKLDTHIDSNLCLLDFVINGYKTKNQLPTAQKKSQTNLQPKKASSLININSSLGGHTSGNYKRSRSKDKAKKEAPTTTMQTAKLVDAVLIRRLLVSICVVIVFVIVTVVVVVVVVERELR